MKKMKIKEKREGKKKRRGGVGVQKPKALSEPPTAKCGHKPLSTDQLFACHKLENKQQTQKARWEDKGRTLAAKSKAVVAARKNPISINFCSVGGSN